MKRYTSYMALLAAVLLCLSSCTSKVDRQTQEILSSMPFEYNATIEMGKRSYDATITRTQNGDVTVVVWSAQWADPLTFFAGAEKSGLSYGDYILEEPLGDSSAASVAVLLRQGLLRLSAEPAQKIRDTIIVKNGALSAAIDAKTKNIIQITLPNITIAVPQ